MQVRILIACALILGINTHVMHPLVHPKNNKTTTFVPSRHTLTDTTPNLHAPVKFTSNGIQLFLKQTFNHPNYAQEVLAHDFSHLVQFLQHGVKTEQKRAYPKATFRLFINKMKATPFINAYSFSNMLTELPELLNNYFIIFKLADLDPAKMTINEISMQYFASQVSLFKDNPKLFFDDLSQQIIEGLNNRYEIAHE